MQKSDIPVVYKKGGKNLTWKSKNKWKDSEDLKIHSNGTFIKMQNLNYSAEDSSKQQLKVCRNGISRVQQFLES